MAPPTFTYQGRRFLWGYTADRDVCGLWEIEEPSGPPLRTWPMSEHEHAWQVFRSAEPNAVSYVPGGASAVLEPLRVSEDGGAARVAATSGRLGRAGLLSILTAVGLVVAGVEIAAVVSSGSSSPVAGLPPGQTLSSFERTVRSDLGVKGITSVQCSLPDVWRNGKVFTCNVFDAKGTEVGDVVGTVVNTQRGSAWNADLQWHPGAHSASG
jgi:hypothetical protein